MTDAKEKRDFRTFYVPPVPFETPLGFLTVFAMQTADTLFFPFLRRDMGKKFWGPKQIAIGLAVIVAAIMARLYFPWAMLAGAQFFPRIGRANHAIATTPLVSEGVAADSYYARQIVIPLAAFLVVWFLMAVWAWIRAVQTTRKGEHSYLSGVSRLEAVFRSSSTYTVQRYLEPLTLLVAGYIVGAVMPALGTIIFWAAVPYWANQRRVWKHIEDDQLKAFDAQVYGEYQGRTIDAAMQTAANRDLRRFATPGPPPPPMPDLDDQIDTSATALAEALRDLPDDMREQVLKNLKQK